uniref:Uncharacterized protein n=1 Tax=Terrapene triunguis TaxID=2587831 RepID=A0A674JIW4_9SAUR
MDSRLLLPPRSDRCGGPALWGHLPCPRAELRLELVLRCGQAFR